MDRHESEHGSSKATAKHQVMALLARARALRLEQGLTQGQAGARVGLQQSLVSRIESGRHMPHLDFFLQYLGGINAQFTIEPVPAEAAPKHEKPAIEIERKFLVTHLPEAIQDCPHEAIRQGYLAIGTDGSEARIRDRAGSYTMTVKSKGDLSRGEWEVPISTSQFDTLWPATVGKRIEKTRYTVPYGNASIELDVYEGALAGLISAEVEFADEASAQAFQPPDWLGSDVTAEKAYKNQSLALNGIPSA